MATIIKTDRMSDGSTVVKTIGGRVTRRWLDNSSREQRRNCWKFCEIIGMTVGILLDWKIELDLVIGAIVESVYSAVRWRDIGHTAQLEDLDVS